MTAQAKGEIFVLMKYAYIVFSRTNTMTGGFIRAVTSNFYNHTSFSLDESLENMYSSARYYYDAPFAGGFVIEHPARYTAGVDAESVMIKLCRIRLTERMYDDVKRRLDAYLAGRESKILYNTFGAVTSYLGHDLELPDTYTCVEFVSHTLGYRTYTSIRDFERRISGHVIYRGKLADYLRTHGEEALLDTSRDRDFFTKRSVTAVTRDTLAHFRRLFTRMLAAR